MKTSAGAAHTAVITRPRAIVAGSGSATVLTIRAASPARIDMPCMQEHSRRCACAFGQTEELLAVADAIAPQAHGAEQRIVVGDGESGLVGAHLGLRSARGEFEFAHQVDPALRIAIEEIGPAFQSLLSTQRGRRIGRDFSKGTQFLSALLFHVGDSCASMGRPDEPDLRVREGCPRRRTHSPQLLERS